MENKKTNLFEPIYRKHHAMVFQMCLGFVKGKYDVANDISQEIFINIWNKLDSFKGASSYKTWIYRITVNTCLQYLRDEKKETTLAISEIQNRLVDELKNTEGNGNNLLYRAIGQLNKLDRIIIIMVLEEQDNDMISEILGIKPANVRVKIHRIKKRLKNILNNLENG